MHDEPDRTLSEWPGILVWLVVTAGFLMGSVVMINMAFGPLVSSMSARGWEPAEAIVQSSFVDTPHRRQYALKTQYAYQWKGEAYESDQVFFDDMVGVRRSYYHAVNRDLLRHKSTDNPLQIWVNPKEPGQAVIFRDMRWDKFLGNMVFFLIWAVITYVLTRGAIEGLKDLRNRPRAKD